MTDEFKNRNITSSWFKSLRNQICSNFEKIDYEYSIQNSLETKFFEKKNWERPGGGGGEMSIMRGNIFEKVGVNISTVYGAFSQEFSKLIPGAEENPSFFATGISVVAHMSSPFVPAVHFNTRYIETTKSWFGGGADLTPTFENNVDTEIFHNGLKSACDKYDLNYYPKFSKACDEYFYLKHRKEPRGIGGIFYDYLNSNNFDQDFGLTVDVGKAFMNIYPEIVRRHMFNKWSADDKEAQLIKRGRYVEFNLLYDRGTKFGIMTDGNPEAILMSLPPLVKWY